MSTSLSVGATNASHSIVDVAIVGGGPAGLYAAYYAGLRELSCCVIDAMPEFGGRLTALFADKPIYDMPGFPKILARDLVSQLLVQAKQFPFAQYLQTAVENIAFERSENCFVLTGPNFVQKSRRVLLAGGIGLFSAKPLPFPEATRWNNRGLFYAVETKESFANKAVVIAGGGDSAVDWALELQSIASSVTLVHRTEKFRAHAAAVSALRASKVSILTGHEIIGLEGKDTLKEARIESRVDKSVRCIPCEAALVMFGFLSDSSALEAWGLKLGEEEGSVAVDMRMESSVPGIYAAGDLAWHQGKVKLIATAVAEAAMAINQIKHSLSPEAEVQPIYSTTLMEAIHGKG